MILHKSHKYSLIFKTYETDLNGISNKLGFSKRSFAEWGTQVSQSYNDAGKGLSGFKQALLTAITYESPKIKLIDEANFSTVFNTKNAQSFFDNFNNNATESTDILKKWCNGLNVTDKTMRSYLTDCMQNQISASFDGYNKYVQSAIANNEQLTLSAKAGQVVLKGFAIVGNVVSGILLSMVASKILQGIDNYIHRVENAKQALDDFYTSAKESKDELDSQKEWIESNGEAYEKLSKGVDEYGHNISLTADEFSEYNSLTSEIADMFPNMVKGYNDQNKAILKNKGSIDELTKSYEENVNAYYASIRAKSGKTFSDYKTGIEEDQNKTEALGYLINNKNVDTKALLHSGALYSLFDDVLDKKTISLLEKEIKDKFRNGNGFIIPYSYEEFDFSKLSSDLQQKIIDVYNTANDAIDTETEKVRPILEAYLYGSTSEYDSLDEDAKKAVQNFIRNIDSSFYSSFNNDADMQSWLKNNVINPLKNGVDSEDLAIRFQTLFALNEEDFDSYQDYINAVQGILDALSKMTDKNGKKLFTKDQINNLGMKMGISGYDSNGSVTGQNLIDNVKDKFKDIKDSSNYIDGLSEDELRILYKFEPDKNTSLAELKNFVKNQLKPEAEETTNSSTPKTFTQAWEALGTTGDENTQKKEQEAKDELLELAKAGKLTPEVLENNKIYATLLKSVGNNAAIAADKINKMVKASDQLSSMKSGIGALSNVLAEKKDNLSHKETKKVGIGADKLAGFDDSFKDLDAWENFEKTLGDGEKDMEACKEAANKLATEWVNSNNFLSQLDETHRDYYISTLKEMGVKNAEAVVDSILNKETQDLELSEKYLNAAKESTTVSTDDLSNATAGEIDKLADEQKWSKKTKKALYKLALQKKIANGVHLNTAKDINNLKALVKGVGGTGKALAKYQKMLKHGSKYSTSEMASAWRAANKELEDAANQVDVEVDTSSDLSGSGGKSPEKNKPEKTKQSFDWLERRVSVLTDKLGLLKAKIENVFTVKKKNSILNDEIKKTNALIKSYQKQAKIYKKQANASATYKKGKKKTKLSKDLIKKIQNGQIKGSRKQLVETYGEADANAIQKYQDYWDKYLDAKTNIQSAKTQKRQAKIQKRQNRVDYYDSAVSAYDAQIENVSSTRTKINLEKKRLEYVKKSYKHQIKIAELEKDAVKAATLIAQKWKEIADTRKSILQHTLDDNSDKRNYNDAAYENATSIGEKKRLIQDNINSYNSDNQGYAENVSSAKEEANTAKNEVNSAARSAKAQLKKTSVSSKTAKAIRSYIKKGKKVPEKYLNQVKEKYPTLYTKLVEYNTSVENVGVTNDAVAEAQKNQKLSAEENKANIREERSKSIQLDIDAANNTTDRLAAEYENLTTASDKNSNIDKQLEQQRIAHDKTLEQNKNNITDKAELAEANKKEDAEWEKTKRNQKITKLQNLSDEKTAQYELNQQLEANANTADKKNEYETISRYNLRDQYAYQIQIAEANKDTVEQARLRAELEEKIEESYKKQIENIREEYNLLIGMNDAKKSTINAQISALQANGYGISADMYKIQMELDQDSYQKSIEEINRIYKELPNLTGTALQQAKIDLESEKQAAWGYQQAIAESQQAINDINLGKFERLKTMLEYIANDLEYMQNILSHSDFTLSDKGISGLTMEGLANMALNFAQISNNQEQISNLYDQIAEKRSQLANPVNTENGDQLEEEIDELIQQAHELENANYDLGESIKDSVIDSLNSMADALDESISKYKDALQTQKDLYDYRKKVSQQLKSIASLEKQLAALQGDQSEEARARIQQIQMSLEEERENLKETEYDKYIQDQEEMLDKVSEDFQDFIANVSNMSVVQICNGMKDAISANLPGIESSIQQAFEKSTAIGNIATSIVGLTETLDSINYAGKVKTSVDENGNTHYKYQDDEGNEYDITLDNTNATGTVMGITKNGEKVVIPERDISNADKDITNATSTFYTQYGTPNKNKIAGDYDKKEKDTMRNAVKYFLTYASSISDPSSDPSRLFTDPLNRYICLYYGKMLDTDQEDSLLEQLGIKGDSSDRNALLKAVNKLKELGFSRGGIAAKLNRVALDNGDDGWVTIQRGEAVLNSFQTKQFQKLTDNLVPLNTMVDSMGSVQNAEVPIGNIGNSTNIKNVDIHLDGSNVVDADSFINTLHNPRVIKEVSNGVSSQIGTSMSNCLGKF